MALALMPDDRQDGDYLAAIERAGLEADAAAQLVDTTRDLPPAICALTAPPIQPIRWLIDGLWPAGEFGLLVGDGGAFKSSAALHLAAAVAGGYPAFDRYATEQRPVLIISAEDPEPVVLMRLEAFVAGHHWDRERVLGNTHILASPEATLQEPRWRVHLEREMARIQPGFLVLDPWAELLGGEENSNTEARPMIKYLRRLAEPYQCATSVVHHAGKAGQDKRTLDRIRGASALPSAARVILFFDYRAEGIAVENLKMSRSARLDPFVIDRHIESEPENRAMWRTARLTVENERDYVLSRAETFVMTQLHAVHPRRLHTGALRDIARDMPGIRNEELATALTRLTARGRIDWVPGPHSSKQWGLTEHGSRAQASDRTTEEVTGNDPAQGFWAGSANGRPQDGQNQQQQTFIDRGRLQLFDPAHPAQTLPGHGGDTPDDPAPPKGGAAGSVGSPPPGQGQPDDPDDLLAELDERMGMREEPPGDSP